MSTALTLDTLSDLDRMTVTVPPGELDGIEVKRFTVTGTTLEDLRNDMAGRTCNPGEYTALYRDGQIWMSDTTAERRDHQEALWALDWTEAKRVIVNGLGLGMIVQAALSFDTVEHIDVVELDERVVKLIGPHYAKDPRVTIIHTDAYEQMKRWPRGTTWDVGWTDIWGTLNADNLPEMARFNRSYGRRCTWHGCWGQDYCEVYKRVGY